MKKVAVVVVVHVQYLRLYLSPRVNLSLSLWVQPAQPVAAVAAMAVLAVLHQFY
jgi:hypothetical protein